MLYYVDFREDVQERYLLYKERREQKLKMLKVRNVSSVLLAKWFNQCSMLIYVCSICERIVMYRF